MIRDVSSGGLVQLRVLANRFVFRKWFQSVVTYVLARADTTLLLQSSDALVTLL